MPVSKKNGNVQTVMSLEQARELDCAVIKALPRDMTKEVAQGWIGNARKLRLALRQALMPLSDEGKVVVVEADSGAVSQFAEEWERLYRDEFGLAVDFSQVRVPTPQPGFGWLMFVAKGLTPNAVYATCEKLFPCWRYTQDLDSATQGRNDREPTEPYAICLRDRVEPDEELKCLSANQLAEKGIMGNTLLEALLLELWHFKRTGGEYLNVANWNLCYGSRDSDGSVPHVYWNGGTFQVSWYYPGYADDNLRARSVIS